MIAGENRKGLPNHKLIISSSQRIVNLQDLEEMQGGLQEGFQEGFEGLKFGVMSYTPIYLAINVGDQGFQHGHLNDSDHFILNGIVHESLVLDVVVEMVRISSAFANSSSLLLIETLGTKDVGGSPPRLSADSMGLGERAHDLTNQGIFTRSFQSITICLSPLSPLQLTGFLIELYFLVHL